MPDRFAALVAVHLFLVRENEVLLLRRFNTGYEDGNYGVPAGHLDGGEEYRAAMIRETREELGVMISSKDLKPVSVMHRRSTDERIDFFFSAERWRGEITNCEPDKCDALHWLPFDDLPPNTIPYVRRALYNFRYGIAFDSYGWNVTDGNL